MFDDIKPRDFWDNYDYAREHYIEPPFTPETLASVEAELGVRLPASFVALMRTQNGGAPKNRCWPMPPGSPWEYLEITSIMGIGGEKSCSLLGAQGSLFMQKEWGYPNWGVCICTCPSAGHDMIMLDYREEGEPSVVHVGQEADYHVTPLADDFETFMGGLVHADIYDTSADDLEAAVTLIREGTFSSELGRLMTPETAGKLRGLLTAIAQKKGYLALHADPLSLLVYDLLFDLYAQKTRIESPAHYLEAYPALIAFGDGEISTGGYAPGLVETWLQSRIDDGLVIHEKSWMLSAAYRQVVTQALNKYVAP